MAATDSSVNENIDAYTDLFCQECNTTTLKGTIGDYRRPNEGTPRNIQPHLALMEKGWIVSTGTQRCFFDLLLSPEDKCEGLITVDIDPRVKAYNSFLVLLLYTCENLEEFHHVWKIDSESLVQILREKINTNKIWPTTLKLYFNKNSEDFAHSFFSVGKNSIQEHFPPEGDNTDIEYYKDEALFQKLRRYTTSFKIISRIGNIEDLRFAKDRTIAIIDISNIADYSALNFIGLENSTPRIISTDLGSGFSTPNTKYYSDLYKQPSEQTITKMDLLFKFFRSYEDNERRAFADLHTFFRILEKDEYQYIEKKSEFSHLPYNFYSEKSLTYLQEAFINLIKGYKAKNALYIDWHALLVSPTKIKEKPASSTSTRFNYEDFRYILTHSANAWIEQSSKIDSQLLENPHCFFETNIPLQKQQNLVGQYSSSTSSSNTISSSRLGTSMAHFKAKHSGRSSMNPVSVGTPVTKAVDSETKKLGNCS